MFFSLNQKKNEPAMKKLEKELFYIQMFKLFGENEATSDDTVAAFLN